MPNGEHIDWERTGLLLGVALAALALLGKVTSWAPVQWAWAQIKRLARWTGRAVITPLFKHEINAASEREVRVTELEAIVVRQAESITAVGDKVTAALVEIGERVDASVCACRDSIADLAHETRDALANVAETQRGTNRILQSVVTLDPKKISEALIQSALRDEPRAEYQGEDRRLRRARDDRPGEEPKPGATDRRGRPRTRDDE